MKTIILDVKNSHLSVKDVEDRLETWYRELDCEWIDIVVRNIGGKRFNIICDDMGLLKPNKVAIVDRDFSPMIVGNIAITNDNGYGELTSLTDDDVELILKSAAIAMDANGDVRLIIKSEDSAW